MEPRLLVHNNEKECVEQMKIKMMGARVLPCGAGRVGDGRIWAIPSPTHMHVLQYSWYNITLAVALLVARIL